MPMMTPLMSVQTYLVTGAAGFVGSRLARALLDRGERVIGLDNLSEHYPRAHKDRHLADLLPDKRFTFVQLDLRDAGRLRTLFAEHKFDAVAHLAAMAAVRYSIEHPLVYGEVNVQASMNLMDAVRRHGNPRMILSSTSSVYGADTPVPFVESAPATMPLAPYPASKRAMELFAHCFHHLYQTPIACLRLFNVYGPQGRPDMMPWIWSEAILRGETITLFNNGELQRDWTYIDDIVAGCVAALEQRIDYEIINLGCGTPVRNIDFIRTLESLLGRRAKIENAPTPPSEPPITFADITKAKRLLGYAPKVNVEEGLPRFIDWARREAAMPF